MTQPSFATNETQKPTVAFGICGSFCTLDKTVPAIQALQKQGWNVQPVISYEAASQDTRFGTAAYWRETIEKLTGNSILDTLAGVEPLGPKGLADGMVIAPCTGTTLARLDMGLSDTPITLAAKSLLRIHRPIVLAVSTNDGLGASAQHIGALLVRRDFYFVPFGQDDCIKKPMSLKADFTRISDTLSEALHGRQIQPILAK